MSRRQTASETEVTEELKGFDDFDLLLGDIMRGDEQVASRLSAPIEDEGELHPAIENTDPSAFGTPGFIAGNVRSHAQYLGLDPERAFKTFCAESNFTVPHGIMSQAPKRAGVEHAAERTIRPPAMPRLTMDASDVVELATTEGGTIGSHGLRHVDLARADADELQRETAGSRARLADLLGAPPTLFSYPYGRRSDAATTAVRAAGYRAAVIADADHDAGRGTDPLALPRREATGDGGRFRWSIAPAARPGGPR